MTEQTLDIVYDIPAVSDEIRPHTLVVLVDNEFGVLARVVSLFSGRGYNIESLTVAEVEHEKKRSRITIVTSGTQHVIDQIRKLLDKMVPVHWVVDMTVELPHVERELALVKVVCDKAQYPELSNITAGFGARVVDETGNVYVFELTGEKQMVDEFIERMQPLGLTEVCRTGVAAISKGSDTL
ncbi:MAG: acetolactate synthase small subunit [Alphaproteobacteria bacterium]